LNVKWDSTTKHEVNTTLRILNHAGISISGAILSETEIHNLQSKTDIRHWIKAKIPFVRRHATS
jgi:ABC-type lipopolysaccharide export system ATPase subunit